MAKSYFTLFFFLGLFFLIFTQDVFAGKHLGIEVQGHRGCRALRPENSLIAFEYAMDLGVDVLEMDLALSKDGHLVISHDPRINALICLDHEGKPVDPKQAPFIHELTLDQIKQYDCGSKDYPRFKNQVHSATKIPTLDEVFEMVIKKKRDLKKLRSCLILRQNHFEILIEMITRWLHQSLPACGMKTSKSLEC